MHSSQQLGRPGLLQQQHSHVLAAPVAQPQQAGRCTYGLPQAACYSASAAPCQTQQRSRRRGAAQVRCTSQPLAPVSQAAGSTAVLAPLQAVVACQDIIPSHGLSTNPPSAAHANSNCLPASVNGVQGEPTAAPGSWPTGNGNAANGINGVHASHTDTDYLEQPPETGVLPEESLKTLAEASSPNSHKREAKAKRDVKALAAATAVSGSTVTSFAYPPAERSQIRESWGTLMRWSKFVFKTRKEDSPLQATRKVVVFGGGSFATAMASALAHQKRDLEVIMLLRDPYLCKDINQLHVNTRYLPDFNLPPNLRATTSAAEAISGAQYAVHAVPVQSSRAFLVAIRDLLPSTVPIICVSKGLEVGTGLMMSELIPSALERKQPAVFLSGPSFAKEVMQNRPTGVVAACKDAKLARTVQALFASKTMRVNTTSDVTGVEICGALKNVLAIAAGIVQGLDLGNNALAALISQGCSEIRWLAEKMGAKPTTMSGLSGLGDIMLTCYGDLSRNRSVGVRLGKGERLADIISSSSQVAEGVATAGVVVALARKYRVSLPVLTAVAQVLDNALTPSEAVSHIMNLPQIEER